MIRPVGRNVQPPGLRRAPTAPPNVPAPSTELEQAHSKALKDLEQAWKDLETKDLRHSQLEEKCKNLNELVKKMQLSDHQHSQRVRDLEAELEEVKSRPATTTDPVAPAPMVITVLAINDVEQGAELTNGAVAAKCMITDSTGEHEATLPIVIGLDTTRKLLRKIKEG